MEQPNSIDSLLTTALDGMAQAPLPDTLMPSVMAAISAETHIEPFKLQKRDFLMAAAITAASSIILLLWLALPELTLDPAWLDIPIVRPTLLGVGIGLFELIIGAAIYISFFQERDELDFLPLAR
ncbi:MAG: hypothetical protein KAG66_07905 [Methylococcales bacterium]|nr:hypothetical protein [Methylococcales bacterium]